MARRTTDLETVQIRNEVIGAIAALAAQEVQGVVGVYPGWFPFSSWMGRAGVRVETNAEEVRLGLRLIVEYGVDLPQLALQVQERVKEMIERMTHLTAAEVRVSIHHVKPRGKKP